MFVINEFEQKHNYILILNNYYLIMLKNGVDNI